MDMQTQQEGAAAVVEITTWTQDTLSRLNNLWSEGLSAREIGIQLGVTRNAVMGKIFRMRTKATLAERPSIVRMKPSRNRSPRKRAKQMKISKPDEWGIVREGDVRAGLGVAFLELRPFMCRAPLDRRGEDGLMLSCGAHTCVIRGPSADYQSPYCADHHRRFHLIRKRS